MSVLQTHCMKTSHSCAKLSTITSLRLVLISSDARYVGCYKHSDMAITDEANGDEEEVDSFVDFTDVLWSRFENTSASSCISDCSRGGYQYAAMRNGTHCYCSNTFGRYGEVHLEECLDTCTDKRRENCGGPSTIAVYATSIGELSTILFPSVESSTKLKCRRIFLTAAIIKL
jgi:WSC domain